MKTTDISNKEKKQPFEYYCILDLEGKVEILECPVLLFDVSQKKITSTFHHYVHPTKMEKDHVRDYIKGKYGSIGLEEEWWKNPIKFDDCLKSFEEFLLENDLQFHKNPKGKSFAFITCGNWDIKTQIPNQCQISEIKIPEYFGKWINIKEIYNSFYKKSITGMKGMLNQMNIKLEGNHHSGIDDVTNISKIVKKLIEDGAILDITSKRDVELIFEKPMNQPKKRVGQQKTNVKICKFFQQGNCKKGNECSFHHDS